MAEISLICEENLLDTIFHACDTQRRGMSPTLTVMQSSVGHALFFQQADYSSIMVNYS